MPVIVDTCVFSLALRRQPLNLSPQEGKLCSYLARLIESGVAVLLGPVRQELLSGIANQAQFDRLRQRLRALPHAELVTTDYERAATVTNTCRAAGIAGSSVDFLICGVSIERGWPILTTDDDFRRYARVLPLHLLAWN